VDLIKRRNSYYHAFALNLACFSASDVEK